MVSIDAIDLILFDLINNREFVAWETNFHCQWKIWQSILITHRWVDLILKINWDDLLKWSKCHHKIAWSSFVKSHIVFLLLAKTKCSMYLMAFVFLLRIAWIVYGTITFHSCYINAIIVNEKVNGIQWCGVSSVAIS